MVFEILFLIVLQIFNGVFSMSEAAIMSSRKTRLRQLADSGSKAAETAIRLSEDPNRFLSTVQIFITLIGIVGGAFGGATLSEKIGVLFVNTPLAQYGDAIGFALIVLLTTYLSLVIGELVPKRLALRSPESIAVLISPTMLFLSKIMAPIVALLSISTNLILRVLGADKTDESPVSREEIQSMVQQGVEAGVLDQETSSRVEGLLALAERRISTLMTPRTDIVWLNLEDNDEVNQAKMLEHHFSRFPVVDGSPDHIVGMIQAKDVLAHFLKSKQFNLRAMMRAPIFIPDNTSASRVATLFRDTRLHAAFVIDEYGGLDGMVTAHDLLKAIVGEDLEDASIEMKDGVWLIDGMKSIEEVKEMLEIADVPGEQERFSTLGGFVMAQLDAVPKRGDHFQWEQFRFEVLNMDGRRVDKVLIERVTPEKSPEDQAMETLNRAEVRAEIAAAKGDTNSVSSISSVSTPPLSMPNDAPIVK